MPIRGGYLKVKPGPEDLVRGNVYRADPELFFLGAHLTRTFDGSLLIGPTAMIAGARDAYDLTVQSPGPRSHAALAGHLGPMRRHWQASLNEAANSDPARPLWRAKRPGWSPSLSPADVVPGPARFAPRP